MKICPNCGNHSEDGAVFCTECGYAYTGNDASSMPETPVQTYTPPQDAMPSPYDTQAAGAAYAPQQKKSKLPLIIGAVAGVAVLALVIFFVVRAFGGKKTSNEFIGIQEDFVAERFSVVRETAEKPVESIDVTVSAALEGRGDIADALSDVLDGSSVSFGMAMNGDLTNNRITLNLKGSNVAELFIAVDRAAREMSFSIPAVDGNRYVMDFETLIDLANEAGMGMSLSDVLEGTGAVADIDPEQFGDDIRDVTDRYIAFLGTQITQDKLDVRSGEKISLDEVGQDVTANVMVWQPTAEELEELFMALADMMEEDDTLMGVFDAMIEADAGGFAAQYRSGEDLILDLADNLRDRAPDIADNMESAGFTWTVARDSKNNLCLISIEAEGGKIAYERYIDGKSVEEALYFSEGRAASYALYNEYEINGNKRTGKITVNTGYGRVGVDYDIDISKKSVIGVPYGTYELDIRNLGLGVGISLTVGDGQGSATDHTFLVEGLGSFTNRELTEVSVTFSTSSPADVPAPEGREKDISGYTYEEFSGLMQDIAFDLVQTVMDTPEMRDIISLLGGF